VGRNGLDRLGKLLVDLVLLAVVGIPGFRGQKTPGQGQLAHRLPDPRIIGDRLGADIARPRQRRLRILHPLFRIHILPGVLEGIPAEDLLGEYELRQRLQPLLARHRRPGAALWLEGKVEVLQRLQLVGRPQGRLQLGRQLALLLDALEDRLPALLEIAHIFDPLLDGAYLLLIQTSGRLLAITRNEGDGVVRIQQLDRALDLAPTQAQLFRDGGVHLLLFHADIPVFDSRAG